jgi:hypothetical protein
MSPLNEHEVTALEFTLHRFAARFHLVAALTNGIRQAQGIDQHICRSAFAGAVHLRD